MTPFFTIGLPTYNRPEFTRLALQSCLNQDYPHFEIIISDDTPGDVIREIATSFNSEKIRFIKNNPPLGIPRKLNDLLDRAKGPWMVILGDDDLLDPQFLSKAAEVLIQHPDASLIHPRSRLINEKGEVFGQDILQKPSMTPAELMIALFRPWHEIRMSITGYLFPVKTLKRLGGFLKNYQNYFTDILAWTMVGSQGTAYFLPDVLVSLREISTSLGHSFKPDYEPLIRSREEIWEIFSRIYDNLSAKSSGPDDLKNIEIGRKQTQFFIIKDAQDYFHRILFQTLKQMKWFVRPEMERIFRALQGSTLPFLSSPYFNQLVHYCLMVSSWPPPFRFVAIVLFKLYKKMLTKAGVFHVKSLPIDAT